MRMDCPTEEAKNMKVVKGWVEHAVNRRALSSAESAPHRSAASLFFKHFHGHLC